MTGTKSLKFYRFALSTAPAAAAGAAVLLRAASAASAGGWSTVHKYVKRSGQCAGEEILASYYSSGKRTATGEAFDANGKTAAARTWPLGTNLTIVNPHNGRTLTVRINDRGPYGIAFTQGARIDLARGAARRRAMSGPQYLCITEGGATVTAKAAPRRRHAAAPAAKVMTAQETASEIP
jgi:rare lipoprotein A (peptidoglycan hydrolase)